MSDFSLFIEFLSKLLASDTSLVFTVLFTMLIFSIVFKHRARLFERFESELVEPFVDPTYKLLPQDETSVSNS